MDKLIIVFTAAALFAFANFVLMSGINYLTPLFGLPELTYFQTFVLWFVCQCLFKANVSFKKEN